MTIGKGWQTTMNKTIKTALYGRVSHDEQSKYGFSIENQIERMREFAEENNLIIVDTYIDEGYSAGTKKRPALQKMLGELHQFDLIIFTKLDRFTRNVLDANEMVNEFNRLGISIKAIDEDIDTSTADGMFEFNLKVSLAQRELAKGSERIKTVFEYKVKQGQPLSGSVPFGYKIENNSNGTKHVVIDEEAAPIVRDVHIHFLTYNSIRGAARYANDKYNLDRSYAFYRNMLKKEFYCGTYRGNTDFCPAYLDRATFDKIQELIKKNVKIPHTKRFFLLTGLVLCPTCGSKMHANAVDKKRKDGSKKTYIYYRCTSHLVKAGKCHKKIRETYIEKELLQNIERLAGAYIYEAKLKPAEAPKKKDDLKEITEEIDRLNYQHRKKRISNEEYDREYEELEKRLARAQKSAPKVKDVSGIEAFLNSGWEKVYKNLSREDQRALIRSVVKSITFNEAGEIVIDFV